MGITAKCQEIYHLRFDRTQTEPIRTAFSCRDFRQSLYADAMPYYDMKKMMVCEAEKTQKAFVFLNACAAYAQTEKLDVDIMEMENGFMTIFYFGAPMIALTLLPGIAELIRQCDRCDVDTEDFVETPTDEGLCTVRLYLFTHRECILQ